MKKHVVLMMAAMGCSMAFAATNHFTAAVNNWTDNAANWTGTLQDWDDAVIADWTSFKESATAHANMRYNSVTFNNEIIGGTQAQFTFNTSATTITNYFRDRVTLNADVTKNARIGGSVSNDDGDLVLVNNSATAQFQSYGGIHSTNLTLTYTGAPGAKFQLGGGAINSTYIGTTILDGIYADVIVTGAEVKGPFGVGSNTVVLANGSTIEINEANRTLKNKVVVEAGETGTIISGTAHHHFGLDVDGELTVKNGTRWLNGVISGTGTINNVNGTLVMNNTAMDSDFSGTMTFAAVSQARTSDQFGTATLVLKSGANFRGFNDQAGETITIPNEFEVSTTDASDIVRIASAGGANTSPHTVVSNITFTANGNLSLQATANGASLDDSTIVDVTGVISDGANTGNVIIDNEWGGTSYPNGIVKLYGVNTYTGTTTVEDGRVQLIGDASIDDSSEIIMMSDGILDLTTCTGGAYTYGGTVSGSGTVEGDLTMTGTLKLVMSGTAAGEYNVISGAGNLLLGDTIRFVDADLTVSDEGATFAVLPGWASISGTPNLVSISGCEWSFDVATGIATLINVPLPTSDTIWAFNTDGDTEGWYDANGQSSNMTAIGGVLTVDEVTGSDPYLLLDTICESQGEDWYTVEIRARQLETNGVPVAWSSTGCSALVDFLLGSEGWTQLGSVGDSSWNVSTEADGWIVASRDLSSMGANKMVGIRFDMIGNAANIGRSYEVDYIKLTRGTVDVEQTLVDSWEFNTPGDVEGWYASADVVGLDASGGSMVCSSTSGDPKWYYTNGVTRVGGGWDTLEFRVRQSLAGTPTNWTGGGTVSVIQGLSNITPFLSSTDRCTVTPDGDNWYIVELDISACSVDTINSIRLDFVPQPRTVEVDWIRVYTAESTLGGYNGWAFGFDDLTSLDPDADPDGDRVSTYKEYLFGGDPSDGLIYYPKATVVDVGGSNVMDYVYYQRDGVSYSMEGRLQLAYGGWDPMVEGVDYDLTGSLVVGDQTVVTNRIPIDASAKFIRATAE
ncbi:hypothetical protein P4B35_01050 [Pontiellaceae bacterium B12227]|nr:hypothetical protein [Pontiellaceae bacterium B12227]